MNIIDFLNIIIASGLAITGFYISFVVRESGIVKCFWFTTLRIILALVAITAVSNFLVMIMGGSLYSYPIQVCFNLSVLCFFLWMILYYIRVVIAKKTSLTSRRVIDFIITEHKACLIKEDRG